MRMTGYIGGTFDLLHPGHIFLFKRAKTIVNWLVVAINTDEFNLQYKGRKPIMSLRERIEMVEAIRYVDQVVINESGKDSKPTILRVHEHPVAGPVTHIIHGSDWAGESLLKQLGLTQRWLDDQDIEMLYIDLSPGYSSTNIRERVMDEHVCNRGPR